jgi:hypothetical protein
MAKIFQSLKFSEGLQNDLKRLAEMKGLTYNAYVEGVLSNHVLVQKKALRAMSERMRQEDSKEMSQIRILERCRNIANGNPYVSTIVPMGSGSVRFRSLTVEVFNSELGQTVRCVQRNESLKFFSNCLPDLVN